MVKETPELYEKIVRPYIESFPRSRFEWYCFSFLLFLFLFSYPIRIKGL